MERTEKRILIIISAIVLVLVCTVFVTRIPYIKAANAAKHAYIGFDDNAVVGVTEIIDENSNYSSMELPLSDGKCILSMDATPLLEDNRLNILLTADEENTAYVRVILYDKDEKEVGRSGLIKAGEHLKYVELESNVASGDEIKAKILTFEPETYYSLGSANALLTVR